MTPGIDRSRLAALAEAENAAFAARTPKSAAMRARAGAVLPNAVPMQWMTALYRTPAIYVAGGKGAYFTESTAKCGAIMQPFRFLTKISAPDAIARTWCAACHRAPELGFAA